MRGALWLVAGLGVVGAGAALPRSAAAAYVDLAVIPATAAVIAVQIRRRRVPDVMPWWLLIVSLLAQSVCSGLYRSQLQGAGTVLLATTAALCQVAALLLLLRGRSWWRDRGGVLDTLILTTAYGPLVGMILVNGQQAPPPTYEAFRWGPLIAVMGGLVSASLLMRFGGSRYRRVAAYWLLAGFVACHAVSYSSLVYAQVREGRAADVSPGFILGDLFLAGAILHPSRARLGGFGTTTPVSTLKALAIVSAVVVSPVTVLLYGAANGSAIDWQAGTISSLITSLFVVARVADLVSTVNRQARRLRQQAEELDMLAHRDALTGLPNRRAWDLELQRRTSSGGAPFVVALLDLDHFKLYNDRHGHPQGDVLLREAAQAWRAELRAGDLIARYGGEEFGLLFADAEDADIAGAIDRLRKATPYGQTFSCGVARFVPPGAKDVVGLADEALYRAKREGRDRMIFSASAAA